MLVVCTHLNALFMLILNMAVMEIWIFGGKKPVIHAINTNMKSVKMADYFFTLHLASAPEDETR